MSKLARIQYILKQAAKVSGVSWWPKYIYHYTDISNAVGILKQGRINSRNNADLMANENANIDVINHTSDDILDYARFYFRPKTPTQYRNEGFLPKDQRQSDANVPVPIFFAFKADKMLERDDAFFSEISLARNGHALTNDLNDFEKFDFQKIYSDGAYHGEDLTPYRHAEFTVPSYCDLTNLSNIWCRSNAEYNYFCYLLKKEGIYEKYKLLIGLKENEASLFYKNALFISKVNLEKNRFTVEYKNSRLCPPERKNIEIKYIVETGDKQFTKVLYGIENPYISFCFTPDKIQYIERNGKEYVLKILFDNHLVFEGSYSDIQSIEEELPF